VTASTLELCLQNASGASDIPAEIEFEQWVETALRGMPAAILTIRIVDEAESAELNRQYRHKTGPTNVLSFPAEVPEAVDLPLLGDLVICAPLVASEAAEQGKPVMAHWAHLVIHGTLHLLGFDHIEAAEAEEMESLEVRLLRQLGLPNPYA
jgi:probable rRNA maturation factor